MTNADIARILLETAQLMRLAGENEFKARAYETASDAISDFPHPVEDLINSGRAIEIEGVGKSIAHSLQTLVASGTLEKHEELVKNIPRGLLDVLRIKGLGPRKVQQLWLECGISEVTQLHKALRNGELQAVKGFGGKTQEALLQATEYYLAQRGRLRLPDALTKAEQLLPMVGALPGCQGVRLTGGMQRSLPVVEALEFVVGVPASQLTLYEVIRHLGVTQLRYTLDRDPYGTFRAYHPGGFSVVLYEVAPDELDSATRTFQFPEEVPESLRVVLAAYPSETWDYLLAHPEPLPPMPLRLVEESDLRGILHAHSTYSDGQHSLRVMAEACIARGYQYLGITDHSRTAAYAGGLSIERVAEQHREIDTLNAELAPFRIFKGIESDILPDGSLDYPDDVLARFDFVIASIHSGFAMTEAEATQRLIRAAQNPYCTCLGHPTGRLLLAREGYPVDMPALLDACAEVGTAIELNSHPYRLDLDWTWLPEARARGIRTSLNPDAHSTRGLDDVKWGVRAARKGLVSPSDCLNCLSTDELKKFFIQQKRREKV